MGAFKQAVWVEGGLHNKFWSIVLALARSNGTPYRPSVINEYLISITVMYQIILKKIIVGPEMPPVTNYQ